MTKSKAAKGLKCTSLELVPDDQHSEVSNASIPGNLQKVANLQMETMLNYSFSPKGIHPLSVSIFFVGLLYVGILFLTTLYKNPTQSALNTELQNTLVCADYYSWQIYGFVYYINHLEQLRNLKEGLMDKDAWSTRGFPNYYDSATTWMGDGAGLSYLPDK
jgi:hypothetical protein